MVDISDIQNYFSDVSVDNGNSGKTIYNHAEKATLKSDGGSDIYNEKSNTVIKTGTGGTNINVHNDYAVISNTTIEASGGNNNIYIDAGTWIDDTLQVGDNVKIKTGAGDDTVELNYAENVTVDGGTGNDTIKGNGRADWVSVNGGDGNDYIELQTYGHYDERHRFRRFNQQ